MPNYLKLMRSIKEPKNRHYHWASFNENQIRLKKLAGYDFVHGNELIDNKIPDKKDRFQRGQVYIGEDGLVRLGDMVLMQTSKENWDEINKERKEARDKKMKAIRSGGHLAPTGHMTHADFSIKRSKYPPDDERPKEKN